MKKALITVVIVILFLVIAIYSVWKSDAKSSGLPEDAFSQQVYYGSVKSNISSNSAKTYSNGAIALGQYSSKEHVEYLKKENNLSNYVYDETTQKEYIRLFEVADMILMPDVRGEGKVGTPRDAEYFLKDIKNGEEEGLYEGGVVKLKRNGSDQYLTYIEKEKYEELKNQPKTAENLEKLKKHFTLDEEGKIIVIGWKEIITKTTKYKDGVLEEEQETTTYEYKDIPYNYKDVLEQYEVDFNFLYALLIYGNKNTQFAYDFAKYIIENTDVVFMIYDNENTTVEEKTTTYDEEITFKGSLAVNYDEANIGSGRLDPVDFTEPYPTKKINYKKEVITTTTEVLSFIDIKEANLWCANFTYEYIAGEPTSKEEPEQNSQQTDSQISNGEPKTIDSSYEFYNDIQGEISEIEAMQEEKLKAILKDVLIANDIKQYLYDNIGDIAQKSEDIQNDYKLFSELSLEFVEMVKDNNIVRTDINTICINKKIDDYMKNNSGVLREEIPASEISIKNKARDKIEENLKNFANNFQESNYDNTNFENLVWENIINVIEDRKHINENVKTKLTITEMQYNKVNYTFSEKTDTNQETDNNFIKIYKNHNIKMEYDWLEETINDYDVPQSSKDIFLYMLKIAIEGKGYTENKLESTIIIDDIIISNNSSTQKGEMFLDAPELVIDKDTANTMINSLNNKKAKQKLQEKVDTIMEYQENEGISALFVIAAIDVEYDGVTEEINVEEFLEGIKEIKNSNENGEKTINEICNEYAEDTQWVDAFINKMNSLYLQKIGMNKDNLMDVYLTNYKPSDDNWQNLGTAYLGGTLKINENGEIGIVHPNIYTNDLGWYVYEYENKQYVMLARLPNKSGSYEGIDAYEIIKFEFNGTVYEGVVLDCGGYKRDCPTLDVYITEGCQNEVGQIKIKVEATNTFIVEGANHNERMANFDTNFNYSQYNEILRYK